MKYKAFISYRRGDASAAARWLRNRLLAFRPPRALIERLPPAARVDFGARTSFFLDTSYEVANKDFWTTNIEPALRDSEFLIVVSSPAALLAREDGSESWVAREISTFLAVHGAEEGGKRILVALAPGAPEDRFPGSLGQLGRRWDWADLRTLSRWHWLKPGSSERLSDAFLKIAAALFDVPQDLLPTLRQEEARRRGRLRLMVAGAAAIVTVVLTGALAWAVVERGNAVRNYEAARDSVDRLVGVIAAGLRDLQGVNVDTVDRALVQVERLVDDLTRTNAGDPLLDRSRATMLHEFAKTYQSAGAMVAARQKAEESLGIRHRVAGTRPDLPEVRAEVADSSDLVGDLLRGEKKFGEARAAFARAHALRSALIGEVKDHRDRHKWLLGLSMSHVRLGDTDFDEEMAGSANRRVDDTRPLVRSAAAHYETSLGHSARLYLGDPESPTWRRELSWGLNKLGDFKARLEHWEPAIAAYEHALCLRRGLREEDPGNTRWASDVSWTLQKLGVAHLGKGDANEAEINLLEMVFIRQQLVTHKAGDQVLRQELILAFVQLAEYERRFDRPHSVLALLTRISRESEHLKGPDGSVPARLRLPDTGRLDDWVRGRLSPAEAEKVQEDFASIMNRQIFQKASTVAYRGYRPECLRPLDATLKALPLAKEPP